MCVCVCVGGGVFRVDEVDVWSMIDADWWGGWDGEQELK